ncbi:MAG: DNA adenine methylase, partial [Planctomycetaceae bacterium]
INLCRVIADEDSAVALFGSLSRMIMHETLFREAAERVKDWKNHLSITDDGPNVERAIDYMICSWFGRNGVAGTQSYNQGFCARYTKNGGHAAKRWVSAVESIPAWHARIRRVTILKRDAFAILDRIEDAAGVVIYCDPPYLVKGAKYVHDFTAADHARLAALLRRFQKTRVIVSYYDDPQLAELYPKWAIEKIVVNKSLHNGHHPGAKAVKATEVLLTNF